MNRFDSDAQVALDMLAMKPLQSDAERRPVEFQPPRNYLCYLRYDSRVFRSATPPINKRWTIKYPKSLARWPAG